jgi:hypothetical protein
MSSSLQETSFARRFLLRFIFAYLILYMLQFLLVVEFATKAYKSFWIWSVSWLCRHLFDFELSPQRNGSGDTTYDFAKILFFLVLAAAAGLVWTLLDGKRANDARVYQWLRVYVRFTLGAAMIVYGAYKIFEGQFGPPGFNHLVRPLGDSSPMGLLWDFMGFSKGYTRFAGFAEMLGGVLLIARRTTLLGALVSIGVLANVVLLNFFYDVPAKQFSSHLFAMALLLIAPDARRLINMLVLNRKVEPVEIQPLFQRAWLNRGALVLRTVFIVGVSVYWLHRSYADEKEFGSMASKLPLYGLWEVDSFAVNGQDRPPLLTDRARWRWVVFEYAGEVSIHGMKDFRDYGLKVEEGRKRLVVTDFKTQEAQSVFTYRQTGRDLLALDGTFEGQAIRASLHRIDKSKFLLLNRGFHWVSERPFNR